MGKLKVYELAKMMNLSNTEMLEKLNKMGIEAKSHLSTLEESDVNKVKGTAKKPVKEEKKQEQVHIIRRNVRVINTSNEGKQVDEITTNAAGDIKKSHQSTVNKTNNVGNTQNNRNNSQNKNRNNSFDRRNRFQNNRNNIVITRNGKPVEKAEPEKKVEAVQAPIVKTEEKVETKPEVKKEEIKNEVKESVKVMNKNVATVSKSNENNNVRNNNRNNNSRQNSYNNNNNRNRDGYRKNNNYNSQNNPNYNRNSNSRDNNSNRDNNRDNRDFIRNNNFSRNDQNGDRPQRNNFRRDQRQNSDNTSYQVNKFIKQAEKAVVEQKESREYSSVNIDRDKKKYNEKNSSNMENRKEKIDKNKLREEHSRVSTGKLRGMEISQEGLMDLYERDSDLSRKGSGRKKNKAPKVEMKQTKIIPMTEVKLPETMTVKEFAEAIKKQASEVIKKLFSMGIMATVNQDIDFDTAYLIASEFGITAEKEVVVTEEDILFDDSEDKEEDLVPRPPIVVVMGHVDHGKTSLLDAVKKTNVIEGEAGGITQHIGAYKVKVNDREITFLDTPGHEAFTAMRARGAQITDIAILVVAANDGVMPQTVEAINHAKSAGIPIIVAINKIDLPDANIDRVKQELMAYELVPEEWGGDTIYVPISAKNHTNIDQLLEMVLLEADVLDLKANPNKQAKGVVIEARLDKNKGAIASMLVQRGTLDVGDTIVVGSSIGRIRSMTDEKGKKVKKAGPSTPVEIMGLTEVPQAGDTFYEVKDEKTAKHLIEKRKRQERENAINAGTKVTLDNLFSQMEEGNLKVLNLIVKADVQGSVEAIKQSMEKLSNEEVRVKVIHAAAGAVTESDVTLAKVSNAIIIAFNVRPMPTAKDMAEKEEVEIKQYSIIYQAIDDVQAAMKGMLAPKYQEKVIGNAEIRQTFKISNVGTIGGAYVLDGKLERNAGVRVLRDNVVIHEGKLASLKRFKDDAKEVSKGFECGIQIEKFNDIKEGDIIEAYILEEIKR